MIVDILVLAVLLISALIAFLRGFIREVLTITGVVGGLVAAYLCGPFLQPHMRAWLNVQGEEEPERLLGVLPYDIVADALSYGAVFIVVVIMLSILSHFLAEGAKNIGLGAIDRTLGFVFGLVRGIILLGLLYLPVYLFVDASAKQNWFENSKTHFYLEKTAGIMAEFIPSDAVEDAEKELDKAGQISETRKRLEDINLLKKEDEMQKQNSDEKEDGYTDEMRQQMDQLFDQKSESLNQ